ncbi:hypothetical protein [Pseudomonas sp.]|uniref:hypothetical protein n=1 Tax=Pseudomonas sp. TaxID=306 RepID=UPI003A983546
MINKTALFLSLSISAFSIQSRADTTLCDINLQKIDDLLLTAGQNLVGGTAKKLEQAKENALEAKKAGDTNKCINLTQRALVGADNRSMGGGGAN